MGFDEAWSDATDGLMDVAWRNGFPDWMGETDRVAAADVAELAQWISRRIDALAQAKASPNPVPELDSSYFAAEAGLVRAAVAAIRANRIRIREERKRLGLPDGAEGNEPGAAAG